MTLSDEEIRKTYVIKTFPEYLLLEITAPPFSDKEDVQRKAQLLTDDVREICRKNYNCTIPLIIDLTSIGNVRGFMPLMTGRIYAKTLSAKKLVSKIAAVSNNSVFNVISQFVVLSAGRKEDLKICKTMAEAVDWVKKK